MDATHHEELAFRASYLSGRDLATLGGGGRSFEERALAVALTDFTKGIPASVTAMLTEMQDHDDLIADLFFRAIIQGGASQREVEDIAFSSLDRQRFESLPSVKA